MQLRDLILITSERLLNVHCISSVIRVDEGSGRNVHDLLPLAEIKTVFPNLSLKYFLVFKSHRIFHCFRSSWWVQIYVTNFKIWSQMIVSMWSKVSQNNGNESVSADNSQISAEIKSQMAFNNVVTRFWKVRFWIFEYFSLFSSLFIWRAGYRQWNPDIKSGWCRRERNYSRWTFSNKSLLKSANFRFDVIHLACYLKKSSDTRVETSALDSLSWNHLHSNQPSYFWCCRRVKYSHFQVMISFFKPVKYESGTMAESFLCLGYLLLIVVIATTQTASLKTPFYLIFVVTGFPKVEHYLNF